MTLEELTDDARIQVDQDNSTVGKIYNHTIYFTFVGSYLSSRLTSNHNNTTLWTVPDDGPWYSDNLGELNMFQSSDNVVSLVEVPATLAGQPTEGQEFWFRYKLKDDDFNGTIGKAIDEFDRYRTKFTIQYNDNGTPGEIEFYAPGSVTKHLMGWNEGDPMPFHETLTIEDYEPLFVDYFDRLYNLIDTAQSDPFQNPDVTKQYGKIVNRNTPPGYTAPNPFLTDLARIKTIATGDVLQHDELYPTLVTLRMEDFL